MGNAEKFLAELGWREFSHHLLYHVPDLPERNFRPDFDAFPWRDDAGRRRNRRSEEHTSELQSLMRISYAVFCLKKHKTTTTIHQTTDSLKSKQKETQCSNQHNTAKHTIYNQTP